MSEEYQEHREYNFTKKQYEFASVLWFVTGIAVGFIFGVALT